LVHVKGYITVSADLGNPEKKSLLTAPAPPC
jgi:hypothetical protein